MLFNKENLEFNEQLIKSREALEHLLLDMEQ